VGRPLPDSFYRRPTVAVARDLLGCRLVRRLADGTRLSLVLVETEAYLGVLDRAAHTWGGRKTPRVRPMWGPGGHAYVFRVYGVYDCMNVVTGEEGTPEAVLVRAGVPEVWWRGGNPGREALLAGSGPGKLCRALAITTALSGAPLDGEALTLERAKPRAFDVLAGPRVGVDYAGEAAAWPLRFAVAGCPAVTRRAGLRPAGASPPAKPRRAARRSP
jgi:DNA-3-methyladenine glycosylase